MCAGDISKGVRVVEECSLGGVLGDWKGISGWKGVSMVYARVGVRVGSGLVGVVGSGGRCWIGVCMGDISIGVRIIEECSIGGVLGDWKGVGGGMVLVWFVLNWLVFW